MTLLSTNFSALFPFLFCARLGFVLAKKTARLEVPTLPALITNIGLPALILNAMLTLEMALVELSDTLVAILLVLMISAVTVGCCSRLPCQLPC